MCACIDLYHQTVKVRKDEKIETLNLVYEPEMYEDTEDELTTDTESDIGVESDKDEYSAFVLTLSDITEASCIEKDVDQVEGKVAHLSGEYAAEVCIRSRVTQTSSHTRSMMFDHRSARQRTDLSSHQMNRYFRNYGGYPGVQRYCEKGSRLYVDRRHHYPSGVFLDVAHRPGH